MDKKLLLGQQLAKTMNLFTPQIDKLLKSHPNADSQLKEDGTPVTKLDLALSDLLETITRAHYPEAVFYSEEKYSTWGFPLLAIDPLDGTREYMKNRPEWAVSVGLVRGADFQGEGWIYNPSTQELFSSETLSASHRESETFTGEVSHSEWEKGFYQSFKTSHFSLRPMGSIAYKLGRLSAGKSDFVVSLTPKNIWDIAAGTILCHQSGIKFYSEGKEVTEVKPIYYPPLIWCSDEIYPELSNFFYSKHKHP